MGRVLSVAAASCFLILVATTAHAQSPPPLPSTRIQFPAAEAALTPRQDHELDVWLSSMRDWQKFETKWRNQPAHDPFGRIVARKPQPAPPAWLDGLCAAGGPLLLQSETHQGQACRLKAGLVVDLQAETIRAQTAAARTDHEKPQKNTFFSRVHLDGLWTTTSTDARFYGLVGSHISLVDVGRVQFFGPPGVIVLSIPDGRGSREIRMGYTWGMSVRLADVRLFAPTKNLTLFLDMTKVWIVGNTTYDRLQVGGFDLVGFSLAPRKKR
jgi:hypothetical protein